MWLFRSFTRTTEAKEDIKQFEQKVEIKEEPKKVPKKEEIKQVEKQEIKKVDVVKEVIKTETKETNLKNLENLEIEKIDTKEVNPNSTIEQLFKRYVQHSHKDDEEEDSTTKDCITGEGLLLFAQDLGIEPTDILLLVIFCKNLFLILLGKLQPQKQYLFTKDEFVNGFQKQGIKTLKEIKTKLPQYKDELKNETTFKKFYAFVFDYSKPSKEVKQLQLEVAIPTWQLLLSDK